jgi:AraC-like DNA-binding protein
MMVDEGEMTLQLAGQQVEAKGGDIAVINCSATHTGIAGPQGVRYRIVMLELLEPFAHNEALRRLLLPYYNFGAAFLPLIRDESLFGMLNGLFEATAEKGEGYALEVTGLCYRILGRMVRLHTDGEFVRLVDNSRMRDVIQYIEEHFREPLTTASVSKAFGYDKAYFCRRFKEATGLTPTNYIRILRLENARRLLKEPEMTVAAAAAENGFPDQNYFSRCFKAHYGKTPTKYINSMGKK